MNNAVQSAVAEVEMHEEVFYQSAEFWVGIAFVLIVILLLKPVTRFFSGLITKRISRIKHELEEAENLKLEAQKLYPDYERKFAETDKEIARIVAERENIINETKEKKIAELNIFLQRKQNEADSRIEQEFEQAGKELNALIGNRTIEILKQAISLKLTKADYSRLIDDSINNIKNI